MKRPPKGPWEQDAFTGWRRFLRWRNSARKYIKGRANRRDRRAARQAIRNSDES